jgi:hypothetical protein
VLSIIFGIIFLMWYPGHYFRITGTNEIIWVLIGVDLVLGPSLTLLVYKKGKKSLKFDLSVIVLVQLIALVYGVQAIHSERPFFMVYAVDRFNLLATKDVDFDTIEDPRFLDKPLVGPLMLIATMPEDPGERSRLTDEIIFQGMPDVDRRPGLWSLWEEGKHEVLLEQEPVSALREARPYAADRIDRAVAATGRDPGDLVFIPMIGKTLDWALIVDRHTGVVLNAVEVDPWLVAD